jgi:hypothetical protein
MSYKKINRVRLFGKQQKILQIILNRFNETKLWGNGKLWICVEHVEYICPQKDVFLE